MDFVEINGIPVKTIVFGGIFGTDSGFWTSSDVDFLDLSKLAPDMFFVFLTVCT